MTLSKRIVLTGALLVPVAFAGCGDAAKRSVAAMNDTKIKQLGNLYAFYMSRNGWTGPKDEADFKAFIRGAEADKLSMMGVDPNKVDDLFVSARDQKPFKIRYKQAGGVGATIPVVFEEEGQGGKRQVAFSGGGKVEDCEAARYDELWAAKADPKANRPPAAPSGKPAGA